MNSSGDEQSESGRSMSRSEVNQSETSDGLVKQSTAQTVLEALKAVTPADTMFAVSGLVSSDLLHLLQPGIKVGATHLRLPMDEPALKFFVDDGLVTHAPFGRGEQTITDLSVRKTFQVVQSAVSFVNPKFLDDVQNLGKRCSMALGVSNSDVVAKFHKLLIYGPGDFFKPHRDAVHSENQFATLVIQLPSIYTGGSLIVRNGDDTQLIAQSSQEAYYSTLYAAFFADCIHEVLPIESGIRVCLTFDLCYNTLKTNGAPREQQGSMEVCCKLKEALNAWYDHHCLNASDPSSDASQTCSCHQPLLEPEDGSEYEFWQNTFEKDTKFLTMAIDRFPQSDTVVTMIILDHLMPRNVLEQICKDGVLNSLWAFRGTDGARVGALVRAMVALERELGKSFEVYACEVSYKYGNSPPYVHRHKDPLKDGILVNSSLFGGAANPVKACRCMVRYLSLFTAQKIKDVMTDTGNEGEFREFEYTFNAILIFPRPKRLKVYHSLVACAPSNLETLLSSMTDDVCVKFVQESLKYAKSRRNELHSRLSSICMPPQDGVDPVVALLKRKISLRGLLSPAMLGIAPNYCTDWFWYASFFLVHELMQRKPSEQNLQVLIDEYHLEETSTLDVALNVFALDTNPDWGYQEVIGKSSWEWFHSSLQFELLSESLKRLPSSKDVESKGELVIQWFAAPSESWKSLLERAPVETKPLIDTLQSLLLGTIERCASASFLYGNQKRFIRATAKLITDISSSAHPLSFIVPSLVDAILQAKLDFLDEIITTWFNRELVRELDSSERTVRCPSLMRKVVEKYCDLKTAELDAKIRDSLKRVKTEPPPTDWPEKLRTFLVSETENELVMAVEEFPEDIRQRILNNVGCWLFEPYDARLWPFLENSQVKFTRQTTRSRYESRLAFQLADRKFVKVLSDKIVYE